MTTTPQWALERIHASEQGGAELDLSAPWYEPGEKLRELPPELEHVAHLRGLNLSGNQLLDPEFSRLSDLEILNISRNGLGSIPRGLSRLARLRHLDLSGNAISRLPEELEFLRKLEYLDLRANRISDIPPEVLASTNAERLMRFLDQLRDEGIDYLCEAKLLIVGEGAAGKTTLAKKLLDASYVLDPRESYTEGIDVFEWSFPAKVPVSGAIPPRYLDRDLRVHLWDFAGQEIAYATHQFFLTERSLYALVVDTRRDNANLSYWLNIVDLLSGASPLLLVKNEKQNVTVELNEMAARAQSPGMKDILAVNFEDNRGLAALSNVIRAQIQTLPHIGTRLPTTWKRVREAVLERSRTANYISANEFLGLCERHGFRKHEDKLQLSQFLHDLGIFLHFQNHPGLANIVILKPTWATEAVYRILRDRSIIDRRGQFRHEDLKRLWPEQHYLEARYELLELMRKFRLCYPMGDTGNYLIPQLLPKNQPSYEWSSTDNLQVSYQYEFMPKGIMPRLIVMLHRLIERQEWVWQEGCILIMNGARAEVIENYDLRTIRIRVLGVNRPHLLGAITNAIDEIHSGFRRPRVKRMIPCQCDTCARGETEFSFDIERVREFRRRGRPKMQCQESGWQVDVSLLLEAVGEETDLPAVDRLFVSYAWGVAEELITKLETELSSRGIKVVRDRKELTYKSDIGAFMDSLSRGVAVVVILSDEYLRSANCMRELVGLADSSQDLARFAERVFPIVLPDANIYEAETALGYVRHWEQKRKDLDEQLKRGEGQNLHGFRETLDLYDRIRDTIARLMHVIGQLNGLSPDDHSDRRFDAFYQAIERALRSNQAP